MRRNYGMVNNPRMNLSHSRDLINDLNNDDENEDDEFEDDDIEEVVKGKRINFWSVLAVGTVLWLICASWNVPFKG